MRLRARDVDAIRAAADHVFAGRAIVRLFGSRLNDAARGGDIDLHIVVDPDDLTHDLQRAFRRALTAGLGERAIDTVFMGKGADARPVDHVALADGLVL